MQHLLMTSTVTAVIVSLLLLLFELQYPFQSDIGVASDAWIATVEHIRLMQLGDQTYMKMECPIGQQGKCPGIAV